MKIGEMNNSRILLNRCEKRQLIRTRYESGRYSFRVEGKKVQQLIDDHIRSLNISELMNPREITYDNFLGYLSNLEVKKQELH